MNADEYQLVIIGGGPAGLTAGLYAARARIKTLLIERLAAGGQVLVTDWIENYPGFPEGVTGSELAEKMAAQASRFGLETKNAEVAGLDLDSDEKGVRLADGDGLVARALILATGARPNILGVRGEKELTGRGVSYCATCDGPFFRDQEIAVVGGGDTAVQEAVYLARFASKVTVIHRRDALRATRILQEKAFAESRVEFRYNSVVAAISGDDGVEGVELRSTADGSKDFLEVRGVFILIGTRPNNELLPPARLEADEQGFIKTDEEMRTSIPGVMAAGDIRSKRVRQVANAVGEGAVAAISAGHFIEGQD